LKNLYQNPFQISSLKSEAPSTEKQSLPVESAPFAPEATEVPVRSHSRHLRFRLRTRLWRLEVVLKVGEKEVAALSAEVNQVSAPSIEASIEEVAIVITVGDEGDEVTSDLSALTTINALPLAIQSGPWSE